jgi:hypothetical protein
MCNFKSAPNQLSRIHLRRGGVSAERRIICPCAVTFHQAQASFLKLEHSLKFAV